MYFHIYILIVLIDSSTAVKNETYQSNDIVLDFEDSEANDLLLGDNHCRYMNSAFSSNSYTFENIKQDVKMHCKCPYCAKQYPSYLHLKRHIRMHIGVKSHVCDVCSKGFVQSIDLVRHRRIHTGERPYKCALCGYSAVQESHLLRHMKSKHDARN